jgi:hypothetical protein
MAQATKVRASKNGKPEQMGEQQANDGASTIAFEEPYTMNLPRLKAGVSLTPRGA